MEETTPTAPSTNKTVTIVLIAIIVLLAAVIAYFLFSGNNGTAADQPASTGTASTDTGNATPPAGMPGTTEAAPFDPATATKVAEGTTPEQHVTVYFDAVLAGDYATAYAMLPTSKQQSYGTADAFGEQLKSYGMTEYTIDSAVEEGDETQVLATAVMPGGSFQYLWTFVKDGEGWLVKSRDLPGMGS